MLLSVHRYWEAMSGWGYGQPVHLFGLINLPYVDCHPDARGGFTDQHSWNELQVELPDELNRVLLPADVQVLKKLLSLDPRPHYHTDEEKVYGMPFKGYDIRFRVSDGVLRVEKWEILK